MRNHHSNVCISRYIGMILTRLSFCVNSINLEYENHSIVIQHPMLQYHDANNTCVPHHAHTQGNVSTLCCLFRQQRHLYYLLMGLNGKKLFNLSFPMRTKLRPFEKLVHVCESQHVGVWGFTGICADMEQFVDMVEKLEQRECIQRHQIELQICGVKDTCYCDHDANINHKMHRDKQRKCNRFQDYNTYKNI